MSTEVTKEWHWVKAPRLKIEIGIAIEDLEKKCVTETSICSAISAPSIPNTSLIREHHSPQSRSVAGSGMWLKAIRMAEAGAWARGRWAGA